MSGRAYWLWLAAKEELTALVKNQLLDRFGTPGHLYAMSRAELAASTGLTKRQVYALSDKSMERARAIAYDCEALGISIVTLADAEYPSILRRIPDPPLVLYVKGKLPDLEQTSGIGIVGTRKATPYGLMAAEHFGYGLAKAGCTVVSGMALGADGAAARGALKAGGKTIAVLAGGLNICYPPEHNFLMGDILLSGAVISENPPGTPHDGFRFPIRNRIISGLSRGVLVVEAPLRSGALITARLALDQGREVFAVPGAINAPGSAGCNRLIRDGEAALVTEPRDIIGEFGGFPQQMAEPVWDEPEDAEEEEKPSDLWDKILQKKTKEPLAVQTASAPRPVPADLSDEQKQIVQAVVDGADTPEGILEVTDLPASRVMTALTMLELDGVLARENGRIVIR